MIVGDFRPPLVQDAFNRLVAFSWAQIDFGVPSIYLARIFDPFYLIVTLLDSLGIGLYYSTMIAVYLEYFLVSLCAYFYVKRISSGDRLASFVAAVFITSNVQLLVDREQTAIGFVDLLMMVLPALVVFTEGVSRKSRAWVAAAGVLFLLTFGTFPNYRPAFLCLTAAVITLVFIYLKNGLQVKRLAGSFGSYLQASFDTRLFREYAKYVGVAVLSIALASIWLIAFVLGNLATFLGAYSQVTTSLTYLTLRPTDVIRLIAKWSFYKETVGYPIVPYANVYLSNPLVELLTYTIPALAFGAVILSRKRKTAVFFAIVALLFLSLTDGFEPYFVQLYIALTIYIPLWAVFRESINWILFVVLSYGILIGLTVSGICSRLRRRSLRLVALIIVVAILVGSTYPLATGDVTRNFLDPNIHGSEFPSSFVRLSQVLPSDYWSIVMPQQGTYAVFNYSEGVLDGGNMYPLIFSTPIITAQGTDYLQSDNLQLVGKLYQIAPSAIHTEGLAKFYGVLGIKYIVLENDIVLNDAYPPSSLRLNQSQYFKLTRSWGDLQLYANTYALQKMYVASNAINFSSLADMYNKTIETGWPTLSQSVFLPTNQSSLVHVTNTTTETQGSILSESFFRPANQPVTIGSAEMPARFAWRELDPTSYSAQVESKGKFLLVLLESYDSSWKAYVDGNPVPGKDHLEVDSFANAWVINDVGNLSITVTYGIPGYSIPSVVLSMLAPILIFIAAPVVVVRARARYRSKVTLEEHLAEPKVPLRPLGRYGIPESEIVRILRSDYGAGSEGT